MKKAFIKKHQKRSHPERSLFRISSFLRFTMKAGGHEQQHIRKTRCVGFTLIELLVVVLIIGILSAVALPQYQTAVDKARYSSMMAAVRALKDMQKIYYLANGNYTTDIHDLEEVMPNDCSVTNAERADCKTFSLRLQLSAPYGRLNQSPKNSYFMNLDGLQEILCFAYKEDGERGRRLCKSMGSIQLSSSVDASCSGDCTIYQLF